MLSKTTLVAVAAMLASAQAQSGTGVTTRYWDCCKTSCGWDKKASVSHPVTSCDISNNPLASYDTKSSCDGGTAFACANNSPWAVSDTLAYGYAAVNLSGQTESDWCCSCYELTFTSTAAAGQTMIVQATNTGGDVGGSQFDLMIPGGGVGIFASGCTAQYGSISGWGATYGGVSSADQCNNLPSALQAGCKFRFGWLKGADNPNVNWKKVTCPSALTAITGCVRSGEGTVDTPTSSTSRSSSSSSTSRASSTSSSTSAAVTTSASSGGAAHYGQCGGIGWSGPTTCVSPYTCTYVNDWYSQCL